MLIALFNFNENSEDVINNVYLVLKYTINGREVRFI